MSVSTNNNNKRSYVDDNKGSDTDIININKKKIKMDMEVDDCLVPSPLITPNDNNNTKLQQQEVTCDIGGSSGVKSSTSGSNDNHGSASDLSYQDDANADEELDDYFDDAEVASDYGDNDDYEYDDDDDYLKLQAQFDNVDLPTGVEVEVAVPWLEEPSPSEDKATAIGIGSSAFSGKEVKTAGASSSNASSSSKNKEEWEMDDILRKLMYFKQFDTVADCSDHHFLEIKSGRQPSKSWAKKIQEEWKILEGNLPETIFVRVYESRMDLLRAVIVGPAGTPYHDGLFVFDAVFPPSYPNEPPMVHCHSSGFRLNPNLYECGKVCLSLLNTWSGGRQEMWIPEKSTMLQVLVSIQALILNAEPFFNEPGYESSYRGAEGKKKSREYSEDIFIKSMKKMMYTLKNPPQHFDDLVAGHFRVHAHDILTACKAYAGGAEVGCNFKKFIKDEKIAEKPGSLKFRSEVAKMMKPLIKYFENNGSKDIDKFKS